MRRDPRRAANCHDCATREMCVMSMLREEELAAVEPLIRRTPFRTGDILARQGEIATNAVVIKQGAVFGYRQGLDERQRPIGIARPGTAFGLLGVFANPSQASAIAASAGRACEVPVAALRDAGKRNRQFMADMGRVAVEACGAVAAWSEAMRLPGIVNQLAYVIVLTSEASRAQVVELPTHSALARLLGTTRETIARGLATLEAEGGIKRFERKKCEVHRRTLLARVARHAR